MKLSATTLRRLAMFVAVGLTCLGAQLLILLGLQPYMDPVRANAIGFVVSAQLNFVLSRYLTWGDRRTRRLLISGGIRRTRTVKQMLRGIAGQTMVEWLAFNANVVLAAAINSSFFFLSHVVLGASLTVAAIMATAISTLSTFFVNHYVVFRPLKGANREHDTVGVQHRVLPAGLQRGR